MTRRSLTLLLASVATVGFLAGATITNKMISVQAQNAPGYGFAALAGQRVGQDVDGPYEVDPKWPKPLPGRSRATA